MVPHYVVLPQEETLQLLRHDTSQILVEAPRGGEILDFPEAVLFARYS